MSVSAAHFKEVTNGYEKRTDGLWVHKGKLQLPDGSITTSMLAPNAVTQLIGSYASAPTFTTTNTVAWQATPVTTGSIVCSGARVRVCCSTAAYHTVVGGTVSIGLLTDGVASATYAAFNGPGVAYLVPCSFEVYVTPAAGNHTFTMALFNGTAGTAGLSAGTASLLYVTEEKR